MLPPEHTYQWAQASETLMPAALRSHIWTVAAALYGLSLQGFPTPPPNLNRNNEGLSGNDGAAARAANLALGSDQTVCAQTRRDHLPPLWTTCENTAIPA